MERTLLHMPVVLANRFCLLGYIYTVLLLGYIYTDLLDCILLLGFFFLFYILHVCSYWTCLLLKWHTIYLASLLFWVVPLSEFILGRNLFTFCNRKQTSLWIRINIKLGENRIGVLCSWNYLKVYWTEELKDSCSSM